MRILILGSGGREHALAWKLKQSPLVSALFIAPGNPGTAQCGTNVNINNKDFSSIASFCIEEKITMLIVGPEKPLVLGLYDFILDIDALKDLHFIGPSKLGAKLEGSKAFAKDFMIRYKIPTATYREFSAETYNEGVSYLEQHSLPIVIKADGLASGKGVIICKSKLEAVAEFELMLQQEKFGEASRKVVVEEFLTGIELSVFVLTNGKDYKILPEAKDYKRIGEADEGLNTGGMGAISPVPFADDAFMKKVKEKIIDPTIKGLQQDSIPYIGFIFIGLINVDGEPFVIEYNCRLGDPETEVVLPRLKNDLAELLLAVVENNLASIEILVEEQSAATVMAVSGGYPLEYETDLEISGLDFNYSNHSFIFHSGTKDEDGKIKTDGGRVLCVSSLNKDLEEAVNTSLDILDNIHYEGIYYRKDIGYEFFDNANS